LISQTIYQNFKGIKIENDLISLVTIPAIGGKVVSIRDKKNNFEYVYNNSQQGLKKSGYGSDFDVERPTGIDECFPTIGKCLYPDYPWEGTEIPDHGEIWPLRFRTKIKGDYSVYQEVNGVRFPYLFTREIKIDDNRIIFSYMVKNLCSMDFKYGWSMHPQFVIMEDSEIKAGRGGDLFVDFSTKYDFGKGEKKYKWPYAINSKNEKIDFSKIKNIDDGSLTKLYLLDRSKEKVELLYKTRGQKLGIELNSGQAKIYGIALNKGGWPFTKKPYNWIGIEACNCITDKLSESISRKVHGLLKQDSTDSWQLTFFIN